MCNPICILYIPMRLLLLVHPPVRVVAQRPLLLLLGNVVLLLEQVALDLGVLDGDRPLEDTNALRVLVEDSIDVLGSPKGVLE